MAKHSDGPFKAFLARERVSQADLARGINKSTAFVSLLANEESGASQDTIDDILDWLTSFLGRLVTYEEVFRATAPPTPTEPAPIEGKA